MPLKLILGERPAGAIGIQSEAANGFTLLVSGLEVENFKELGFTLISIREACEELRFSDGVGVVLTTSG